MLRLFSALCCLALFPAVRAAEFSEPAPLAAKSLLLDLARAGDSIVAVGDRGHVLISLDQGKTWTQSVTPTRAMLTAVFFADARHGWAVGHDGVIIATRDGGRTWTRQDAGDDLETVFLDVLFLDAQRGFAVGAYGVFRHTKDGGATWTPMKPVEEDLHFNRIARAAGDTLYVAGEAGTFLASHDGGTTWERHEVPYEGSLFAIVAPNEHAVVVAGLRGHILYSPDRGVSWQALPNDMTVLISTGAMLPDGTVALAGQGGNFFLSTDAGRTFRHWKPADFGTSIAEIIATQEGVISAGEAGVAVHPLPSL